MRILLLGVTGLVGSKVLQQALVHPQVEKIIAPTRHSLKVEHDKLEAPIINFDDFSEQAKQWQFDAVICALGTTMKKVKSKEAFKKIDYNYPMAFAHLAIQKNAKSYALNSAIGANIHSPFFYSRVKGQLEQDLKQLGFESLTFVRPGLITGDRQEFRLGESVANGVLKLVKPVIPKKWQPNHADDIASTLLQAVLSPKQGVGIVEAEQIHLC